MRHVEHMHGDTQLNLMMSVVVVVVLVEVPVLEALSRLSGYEGWKDG